MRRVNLGYACINLSLGAKGRTSRTCRLSNATPTRLEELSRVNLAGLLEVLRWNASHRIKVFRISSGIIPIASHPKTRWRWRERLTEEILQIGKFAVAHGMRLSMHPGQYTVLNSPRKSVVAAAVAELRYHSDFMDALGLDAKHKIILHVGGVYGDRSASLKRVRMNFRALPASVQGRLAFENDERSYGADVVLDLCEGLGVPMVFDFLHHVAFAGRLPERELLERVHASWFRHDGRPELHYSTQRRMSRLGAHADMVDCDDFMRFLFILPECSVDIVLEAKAKDLALLRLRRELRAHKIGAEVIL